MHSGGNMHIESELDGVVKHEWYAPDSGNVNEADQLKGQIFRSATKQKKMPLSEADFMEFCSYVSHGVYAYFIPADSQIIQVRLAKRGNDSIAIELP